MKMKVWEQISLFQTSDATTGVTFGMTNTYRACHGKERGSRPSLFVQLTIENILFNTHYRDSVISSYLVQRAMRHVQ